MVTPLCPNPLYSDTQYLRYHHMDIENMDDQGLADEFYTLRSLLWGLPPSDWLRERVKMLGRELAKRRGTKWQYREKAQ